MSAVLLSGRPAPSPTERLRLKALVDAASRLRATREAHVERGKHRTTPVTREEIIDALRARAESLGHPPTSGDWRRTGVRPSRDAIFRTFVTWHAALAAAGLVAE